MAPVSSVHRIALALSARGGEAPDDGIVSSALTAARARAKLPRGSKPCSSELGDMFIRALEPIVRLTQEAFEENDLTAFDDSEYGDLC